MSSRRIVPLALVSALAVGAACGDSPSEPPAPGDGPLAFATVAKAKVSNHSGPQVRDVVRSEAAWAAVWASLWGSQRPALPAVDFAREMVVVATASQSCFGEVTIESVERAGDALVVRIADAAPTLCLCVAPEHAFHVVRLQRFAAAARFETRITAPACPS